MATIRVYWRGMDKRAITSKLVELGGIIANVLDADHQQDELRVEILKASDRATSLKVMLGDKTGFLKLFRNGDAAETAFCRERKALELLHGDQVPKILFVAEAERAILTTFIKGTPLLETLTPKTVHQVAEHMGQWFGRLSNLSPSLEYEGHWANYLANYPTGFDTDILGHQRSILARSRIGKIVLSHNDNALGNFILGDNKRLYAVDFADSRMKPEGWDLITAARALFGQKPDALAMISGCLLRGYQLTAKNCGLPDNFDQIISSVAFANAAKAA